MKHFSATCAVASGNALGEGALWDNRAQALYWTDIPAARLWCYTPATQLTQSWPMPEPLACFALCESADWLLLGLASRLAFFHFPTGQTTTICAVEPDLATRINDGACDREGRFVFGTEHEPADGGPSLPVGGFYRLDADLSLHRLALGGIAIANGTAFSISGRRMYFCDSPTRVIRCCDYALDGNPHNPRDFAHIKEGRAVPDGATVDSADGLWSARWDGGHVVRYAADGNLDMIVEVPARRPTRPALGGAGLATLFTTSARADAGSTGGTDHDGDVFQVAVPTPGLPEARFAGAPAPTHFT